MAGVKEKNQNKLLTGHFILGECPGFVNTKHVDTTQSFYRGQFSDDSLLLAHSYHP